MTVKTHMWNAWSRVRVAAKRAPSAPELRATLESFLPVQPKMTQQPQVNCIVFSKDRAMQLDACLRSIHKFAPYGGPITVIFRASTVEFSEGYRLLSTRTDARWVRESGDLRRDVLESIDPAVDLTVFHTDDDVFFRSSVLPFEFDGDRIAAFSLRLGINTTYCFPFARAQSLPHFATSHQFIAWDWTGAFDDFAYPLSLNGHVLDTTITRRLLAKIHFTNPNEFEVELHKRRYLVPPVLAASSESSVVSLPLNVVTSTHRNRADNTTEYSALGLNARFLTGEYIDLDTMDFSHVIGAHQLLPLIFRS